VARPARYEDGLSVVGPPLATFPSSPPLAARERPPGHRPGQDV